MEQSTGPLPEENNEFVKSSTIGEPPESEHTSSSPSLEPPPIRDYARALTQGYKVLIKRGVNRYKLFKFFLSKVVYDDDGLHLDEFLLIFELFYEFVESKDPNFKKNLDNLNSLEFLDFLNFLQRNKIFPYQPTSKNREKWKNTLPAVIYDQRAYFRIKGQNRNRDFRLVFNNLLLKRRVPAKPYIGIGYKDKGSRRESALDGSPKWQEVATYFSNMETEQEELPGTFPDESGEET